MKDLPALGSNLRWQPAARVLPQRDLWCFMGLLMCIKVHTRLRMKPLGSEKHLRRQIAQHHTCLFSPHPATACRAA